MGDQEPGRANPVCEATGRVPVHQIFKQGVLLSQPYLMLQAVCFHGQGLEKEAVQGGFTLPQLLS